jgi:hypothetical protein
MNEELKEVSTEKPKYDQKELLAIFDEILFSGEYREDVVIKGKLKVTFTTRSAANTSEITRELDSRKFNLLSSMQEYKALLCICYSIVNYNDKDISQMPFDTRKAFIEKLPSVVVGAISNALVEFDMKTDAAMQEMDAF